VHSFHTLIADLATLARNTATTAIAPNHPFTITTRPTPAHALILTLNPQVEVSGRGSSG